MKKKWLIPVALLWLSQTSATTLLYESFDDLIAGADGIVVGTVTNVEARAVQDGPIYSYVTLSDLDIIYGAYRGKNFTIRIEGGEVRDHGLRVVGSPDFARGERVILFLVGNGRAIVPIVGWTQGVFRVSNDPKSDRAIVTDNHGNRVFGIRDGQLIKEQRVLSDAEIIGAPAPLYPYSELAVGGFGQSDDGSTSPTQAGYTAAKNEQPIELRSFIQEITQRARKTKGTARSLVSVDIGEKLPESEGIDATARAVEEPVEIRQAPVTETLPGEPPKHIDSDAEKRKAESEEETKAEQRMN